MHLPNGHIFVDSPSIQRQNSTWKVRGNYIEFERPIHVEIMASIRHGSFDVDSTFKIDEISMSSPRGLFYVVSTSNRRKSTYSLFLFYHFLTFSALGTHSKLFWYNADFAVISTIFTYWNYWNYIFWEYCNNANK